MGGQKRMKVKSPHKCLVVSKRRKVDGPRLRWWSKNDEIGRSSKVRGWSKRMKVDELRIRGCLKRKKIVWSKNAWVVKQG